MKTHYVRLSVRMFVLFKSFFFNLSQTRKYVFLGSMVPIAEKRAEISKPLFLTFELNAVQISRIPAEFPATLPDSTCPAATTDWSYSCQ